jgi:acyl-coenzyme A synthetase/AMP-(fatty) acid ligase
MAMFLALQERGAVALPLDIALPPAQRAAVAARLGAHWLWDAVAGQNWQPLDTEAPPALAEADYCLVKTTSGSTGQPKPLLFTSANMLADGRQIAATMGIEPEDRNLGAIPFGHSYGLGNLVLPLIAQGTALVCSTEILPDALAAQIERHQATVLPSVPAVLRALAESSVDGARLRSLRRVISAGAPLRPETAAAFLARFGVPVSARARELSAAAAWAGPWKAWKSGWTRTAA